MKQLVHLLIWVGCLQGFYLYSQGDAQPVLSEFPPAIYETPQDQAVIDSLIRWEERVYLHMDRDQAAPGEPMFFKAYVYNLPTRQRFSPSGVLRLELRNADDALVATQYHPIREGAGEGVLQIPEKAKAGTYQLVAHTRWMQNYGEEQFFRKTIKVGEAVSEYSEDFETTGEITFHPEGGRLLAGVQNRLIIKATGDNTKNLQGTILNATGKVSIPVQPYLEGYGMAIFTPEAGMAYQYRTPDGEILDLPDISARGYTLKVNNLSAEKISLEIQPTRGMGRDPVVLKGERDGQTYFIHMLEFDQSGVAVLEIPKAGLPAGFMDFTVTGLDETLWAQRPVWIERQEELRVVAKPLKTELSEGGDMAFRISVTDAAGKPVQTDLSIAVSNASPGRSDGIDTYLKPIALEAAQTEDRRMRFIEDLKAQSIAEANRHRQLPGEIRFPVERSLELHGTAYDLDNTLLINTEIQMMASSENGLVIRELKTDAAGVLHIKGLDVVGNTQLIFRTKGEEQTQRLVKLVPIKKRARGTEATAKQVAKTKIYEKAQKKNPVVESTPPVPFDTTGVIILDEATVEKRREQQKVVPSLYNLQPNRKDVVYQDPERPMPIPILAQQIPGVQYRLNSNLQPLFYHLRRGGGGIVYVVDGMVLRQDPDLNPFTFLAPGDILRMEFYIDAADISVFTAITSPNTGFLVIYTRSGNFLDYVNRKEGGLVFKGFEPVVDFDAWMAERQSNRKLRKTDPKTLYWNPSVQTDEKGEAIIRFRSPGDYSKVRLTVETLTREGTVGSFQKYF